MKQTLVQIKKRMRSVASTEKITSAMKLVSTVKLKMELKGLEANKLYSSSLCDIVDNLFAGLEAEQLEFNHNDSEKVLTILVGSSLGLCGSYNYNLFHYFDSLDKENHDFIILGEKAISHYKNNNINMLDGFDGYKNLLDHDLTEKLARFVLSSFNNGTYKRIEIVYTSYKNSLVFIPKTFDILPLGKKEIKEESIPALIEPNKEAVIHALLPLYVESIIFSKLKEAEVSEQASRRNAMEAASDNANELLDELKLQFNKDRQAKITQDIIEVVSASKGV